MDIKVAHRQKISYAFPTSCSGGNTRWRYVMNMERHTCRHSGTRTTRNSRVYASRALTCKRMQRQVMESTSAVVAKSSRSPMMNTVPSPYQSDCIQSTTIPPFGHVRQCGYPDAVGGRSNLGNRGDQTSQFRSDETGWEIGIHHRVEYGVHAKRPYLAP